MSDIPALPAPVRAPGLSQKAARFFGFGLLFAVAYYVILYSAQRWGGLQPWLANVVGYAIIVPIHYVVHARFTFRADLHHGKAIPRHLVWQVASCLLGSLLTQGLAEMFQAAPALAALIGTIVVNGMSFIVSLFWIFVGRSDGQRPQV
jgi:putative flippase GtrA